MISSCLLTCVSPDVLAAANSGPGPMPLALEHRDLFAEYQQNDPPATSEVAFSNLFLWRDYYRAHWFEAQGCLCLVARPQDGAPFGLPPIGPGDKAQALLATAAWLKTQAAEVTFRRMPEALAQTAASLGFSLAEDRNNYDYVYETKALATLAGRKLHQKKNHYNFFVNNYSFECLPLTPELIPEVAAVQDLWLEAKLDHLGVDQLSFENEAVAEALENFAALGLVGLGIRVDGRMEGFTIGEPLNHDTFLVHLEKANPEVRGLFVALASHFCRLLPPEYLYVNREQDLGLPGLRKAKESLRPVDMMAKYTLTAPESLVLT